MPPTPSTPRQSSYSRPGACVTPKSNAPKPTGLYDSNSVQDRIKQWQSQGAAAAPASDAVSISPESASGIERSKHRDRRSRLSNNKENPEPIESTTKRKSGRLVDRDSKQWMSKVRSSSTPRKRVISDTNWKVEVKLKEPSSANAASRRESRTRELGSDAENACIPAETEREERRRRMREARRTRRRDEERLKEIYGTSIPPAIDAQIPDEDAETQGNVDDELVRQSTRPPMDRVISPMVDGRESMPPEDDGRRRRRSKYAESLGTSPGVLDVRSGANRKGSIFNKTKEIFSKTEQPQPLSNRLPSITAWLEEQPDDPFVDAGEEPIEVPPPLKPRTRRRISAEEKAQISEESNRIWEHVTKETTPPHRRRKRRSRDPDQISPHIPDNALFTGCLPVQDVLPSTPDHLSGGLKRRSAQMSRSSARSLGRKDRTPETPRALSQNTRDLPFSTSEVVNAYSYHQQKAANLEEHSGRPRRLTEKRTLSPIASLETLHRRSKHIGQTAEGEVWDFLELDGNSLERRLTTHDDLLSQLSLPLASKSLRRTRSRKHIQSVKSNSTTDEIFASIKEDEAKYVCELRTLVDGVIPVLLQCVLSKSDSVAAVGLFASSAGKDITRPIVDMGIALERLKSFHTRLPTDHLEGFLSWAQSAQKAYTDYLKAWRLGFQDVVVNLAAKDGTGSEIEKGMPQDQNGDVVSADGKKVDVAYLLKRPLVRVKKLFKSLADIKALVNTASVVKVAMIYEGLTELARKRTQEEQGRLEDEAAANVDTTKARDLRTMTALPGITVDKNRNVKAKDCFSMTLYHTSGQRVDCRIEIILRDNQADPSAGGDILFCEMDDTGRWLLFPPVDKTTVSARKGDKPEDLVLMVRGTGRQAWYEMLELRADDVETADEWMDMLGSNPLPPKLLRSLSFLAREEADKYALEAAVPLSTEVLKQVNGSDIELPIGEPAVLAQKDDKERKLLPRRTDIEKPLSKLNLGGGLQKLSQQSCSSPTSNRVPRRKEVGSASVISSDRSTSSAPSTVYSGSSYTPTISSTSAEPDLQRVEAARGRSISNSRAIDRPQNPSAYDTRAEITPGKLSRYENLSKDLVNPRGMKKAEGAKSHSDGTRSLPQPAHPSPERPSYQRAKSATPSKGPPTNPRIRGVATQPTSTNIASTIENQWDSMISGGKDHSALSSHSPPRSALITEDLPSPPAHKDRPTSMPAIGSNVQELQRRLRPLQTLSDNPAVSKPPDMSAQQKDKAKRHSSSPLKHEYAPSVASSEGTDDSTSEASNALSEDEDTPTPLVPLAERHRQPRAPPPSAFRQPSSSKTATLAPSDSASQGPYRSVPSAAASEKRKAVALVCTWSETGMWVPVNPDGEICSVVVSPGLVEVFETSSAQPQPTSKNPSTESSRENSLTSQPLVGFELTINVMMHGGTGLDITLRSPPTPNSRTKTAGGTVLFRSSSMAEKQVLYHLLNQARMNNPTMLALMAARAKKERERPPAVSFALGEPARHSRASSFGIFGLGWSSKGSSYRASSASAPQSISGDTTESTGSTSRNLLKRLSAGSAFALNRSSVLKKSPGTAASSSLSGSSTPVHSQSGLIPLNGPRTPTTSNAAVEGASMVHNMKVRLHMREKHKDKWLDLGAVRLSVLLADAPRGGHATAADQSPPASGSNTPTRQPSISGTPRMPSASHRASTALAPAKRIVIVGAGKEQANEKKANQTFLDAVLPEAAFERIQRIGIAINVWKEEEQIAKQGGVLLGRNTVWCISFASERECTWVFGLVGRYRYE